MPNEPAAPNPAPPTRTRPQIASESVEKGPGKLLVWSVAAHVAVGLALGAAEVKKIRAATAIEIADVPAKPKAPAPEPPPPPPPKAEPRRSAPQRAAEPAAAPNPVAESASGAGGLDGLPDFGLAMSGGGDIGIPVRARGAVAPPAPLPPPQRRAVVRTAQRAECAEPVARPRAKLVPQPVYGDAARSAGVEGKVRVELSIDELGKVIGVRLLAGLGYGLDEAVIAAAERAEFEPARRCGSPVRGTFLLSMRFAASG